MKYSGFTFIETLVVVAMLSVVAIALQSAITYFYKSNRAVLQSVTTASTAHTSVARFNTNVREASYGDDGSYPILSAGTSTITFFSNTDDDSSIEKVHWFLSNGTLSRGITKSVNASYEGERERTNSFFSSIVNTATPLFRYFDADGTELTPPIDVSQIHSIQTTVEVGAGNATTTSFTLSGFATLRNSSL